MYSVAPVCFTTTYCGGESVSNNELSFEQCCTELAGISYILSRQCMLCPQGMYILKMQYYYNI